MIDARFQTEEKSLVQICAEAPLMLQTEIWTEPKIKLQLPASHSGTTTNERQAAAGTEGDRQAA